MIKMILEQVSKKEMPPRNRQLQPTDAERAEIVKAMETLLKDAPGGGAARKLKWPCPSWVTPTSPAPSSQVAPLTRAFLPLMKMVRLWDFAANPASISTRERWQDARLLIVRIRGLRNELREGSQLSPSIRNRFSCSGWSFGP